MKKTAIVVGANGGIGTKLVEALANDYEVISVARSGEFSCDLTSYQEINKVIETIKIKVDKVDLLVNAAGVATYKQIVDITDDDLREAFMVNTIAPAIFIREMAPLMKHDDSLILSLGSGAGVIPMRGRSIYCATKYALRGLSLSLNEEYKDKNPHFCLITLGSTITNFGPMTAEEKQKAAEGGKAYFPVDWVVNKLVEIINDLERKDEIVLYPSEQGFGTWKKP